MEEEKVKLILLESHKIFLAVNFLVTEDRECLTEYGRGLVNGLLDPDTEHKMPVVPNGEYEELEKKYNKALLDLEDYDRDVHGIGNDLSNKCYEIEKLKQTINNLRKPKSRWFWK